MKRTGKLVTCDYPGCAEYVFLETAGVKVLDGGYTEAMQYKPMPDGWGYTDGKDMCPDHYQYYQDMLHEFWHPIEPKHSNAAEELAEMLEADNSVLEPEDILYTNMPEMNIKVTGPTGTVEARTEDW